MSELEPLSPSIILSVIISIPMFYFIGSLITNRLVNPIVSVGVRMAIGALVTVSVAAVLIAGLGTGLLFYLGLFLFLMIKKGFALNFSDARELRLFGWVVIALFSVGVVSTEGLRSDLLEGSNVYVGNVDASYYSGFGHTLYDQGIETFPENISPETRGVVYHFGDLWFSGLYSQALSILPYYAYLVIYRSLCIIIISLMIFGWVKQASNKSYLGILGVLLTFSGVYVDLFPIPMPDTEILKLFTWDYPLYAASPIHMIALAGIAFSILMINDNWTIGAVGLMFLPFINSGLAMATACCGILLVIFYLANFILGNRLAFPPIKNVLIVFLAGATALIYNKLDGRLDSPPMDILSLDFIYLFIHTLIRTALSQVFVIPIFFGVVYFVVKEKRIPTVVFHVALYLGTLISFAFIFPQLHGNSIQITGIHFVGVFVPFCVVGLLGLSSEGGKRGLKTIAIIALVLIISQATRVAWKTQAYRATFDWEAYLPDHKEGVLMSVKEWQNLRTTCNKPVNKVGFFRSDGFGLVRYSEFTYLKGVLPGTNFYRINPIASDTVKSGEELGYYFRSSLGHFAKKNDFDSSKTIREHLEFLKPDLIIFQKGKRKYYIPDRLKKQYPTKVETESFIVHEK